MSVLVPARNEPYLRSTILDLLAKAQGDIEVIAILDGYWPAEPLPNNIKLRILHVGEARGMRRAVNAAARIATGEFLLKCDAHTLWAEGYDLALKADYQEANWLLTCRRYALDPDAWVLDTSNPKYPIDYHYLSSPFEMPGGLHGMPWPERRTARAQVLLDEELSTQGSMWFLSRRQWEWCGELDETIYGNVWQEAQELGLKTWLGGGAHMVTKRTSYAHWHKPKAYGRGYAVAAGEHDWARKNCTDYWLGRRWPKQIRSLGWLIERFAPVPTWDDAALRQVAA